MTTTSVVSNETIEATLAAVLDQLEMSQKIAWWLIGAHSSERWLQFEFGYQLHRRLQGQYQVVCERSRQDIVVLDPKSPAKPVAAIELKVLGNWWILGNTFKGLRDDVAKVDGYTCASIGVEGGSKRRRGGIVAAVENGGAHWCIFGSREDSVSRYLAQLCREAQECDPIWSFGKKFVGAC